MNPKLLLCAVASVAVLSGCAAHSPPNWNNGPYAEFGFTYDYTISPLDPLSTDEARSVLAIPSSYGPGVYSKRNGIVNFIEPYSPAPGVFGAEITTPTAPPSTLPSPPPM